jgi:hypothetical protein
LFFYVIDCTKTYYDTQINEIMKITHKIDLFAPPPSSTSSTPEKRAMALEDWIIEFLMRLFLGGIVKDVGNCECGR